MKKLFCFLITIAFMGKMEAQRDFDFVVNGIGYNVISLTPPRTACMTGITEDIADVVVPSEVTYNANSITVIGVSVFRESRIRSLHVPNTAIYVNLGSLSNINSIELSESVNELHLSNLNSLTEITIPNNVKLFGIGDMPSLKKLVVLDDAEPLEYDVTNSSYLFTAQLDTLYCGRNMRIWPEYYPRWSYYLKSFVIGNQVTEIRIPFHCSALQKLVIPKGVLDVTNSFSGNNNNWGGIDYDGHVIEEIIIEDSPEELINSTSGFVFSSLNCKKLYIGRDIPYIFNYENHVECEQLIIGPWADNVGSGYGNGYFELIGDSAFVKICKRVPPVKNIEFTTNTYLNVPLCVPIGSLEAYRNSDWNVFFNIVENFEWEDPIPSYSIFVQSNNTEFGIVEGGGDYLEGDTVVLRAVPKSGGQFQNWMENGVIVCLDEFYTFVAERDRSLVANFGGTGVEENEGSTKFYAFTKDKTIFVEGLDTSSEVAVYNIQGQSIYKGLDRIITVPYAGVYIVAVENRRIKVVVE